ncbi:rifin PIR protein, putative [Plasmodium reichenowi]|uniref:Rifin PIR protein, putative n=1 Tax=Plasmodium reichenowi TaxID=5854 RepID=A0A2P9D9C8_PLARE|nr:rifin PIR protein, putative [Plasmodium reichenowi]
MKVHYINILLFAVPLNILEHNQRNHKSPTHYTPKIPTTRSLCECELYAPANYDSDPEMKSVMENFNKQTQQRFEEYDDRMQSKRVQCKDKCDKEIQKIILKDKLEKQMAQQLTTLETKIDIDDIPTCVCEKSLADKVEKGCLRCGRNLGVAVPGLGLLGAYWTNSMVQAAITAGIEFATQEGIKAGIRVGIEEAIKGVKGIYDLCNVPGVNFQTLVTAKNFNHPMYLGQAIQGLSTTICEAEGAKDGVFCSFADSSPSNFAKGVATFSRNAAEKAGQAAAQMTTQTTEALTVQKTAEATSATTILSNPIVISFIVIVIIVILLLIIHLILRYRRKKKMKKKLQYIKLLEE